MTGVQGPKGEDGIPGYNGQAGSKGNSGVTGPQGERHIGMNGVGKNCCLVAVIPH